LTLVVRHSSFYRHAWIAIAKVGLPDIYFQDLRLQNADSALCPVKSPMVAWWNTGFCTTGVWYVICMELQVVIERISELLDDGEPETSNTSMRIPTALRDAATLAVKELGIASSATALTTTALRATLEAVVMQAALDDHYERHPQARPDLGDLAIAAAELDGHPLAGQPGRLRQAAVEIAANHPDASPDDVLLWAEARALPAA
jgi:hypothetical protein